MENTERELEQIGMAMAFKATFAPECGLKVLERLSALCNENSPTYVDGNTHGSAYKEGQRSIILHIRRMLKREVKPKQEFAKD